MDAFATLPELEARLEWELSPEERQTATSALEDASDLARGYGRDWSADSAPRLVRTLVLRAAQRFMRNPDGYTQSRAGDETVAWDNASPEAGSVWFSKDEQKLLAGLSGRTSGGLYSVPIVAYGNARTLPQGFVPVLTEGKPFPMFSSDEDPW